jgi:serine/threonine-protein kinase
MIGDFRSDLKKLGRLDLLDAIGDKAMAYFAELDPRDLTDTALTRQAKALTQIGETRIDQAKFPEADAAFAAAYARASTLTSRHPRDADMLFERAQVEYWRGFLARRRGDFAATRDWLTRYRDSAVALVALEGKKLRAQRELTSGQHNLAVLDFDHGNLTAAQAGFLRERAAVEEMLAGSPQDNTLRFRLADVESWLARTAEADGRYAVAITRYGDVLARLEELVAAEPREARWRFRRADSLGLLGNVLAIAGRRTEAVGAYERSRKFLAELVAQDPKNQQWLLSSLENRLFLASLPLAAGDAAAVELPAVVETRTRLEALCAAEPGSRAFAGWLMIAWLTEAQLRHAAQHEGATPAVEQALALGETLVKDARADRAAIGDFARTCVLAGWLAQAGGQTDAARRHWTRALDVLAPLLANSNEWRLLDPAAQAFTLLDRAAEARPLIERLRGFGYRSLDPFAGSILGAGAPDPNPPRTNQD